ncbi:TonB-dependent receptor [Caenimonas koreensis DSM 17982]|uniref:TonB-dependent receptor n=1 Tax=Caenimonas koreensis DSM 17982 TaxID=1121255 RepID=A0A844B3K7_9BURK|nr:TonB-dependent receptor [Caenimonas koreensis]MRD45816.1 TonB-dependent receptor [Caenimonas koreensis DSM 17982]
MKQLGMLAWVAFALPAPALAQTAALEPVTVTATRTEAAPFDVPAAVDVIGTERIRGAGRPEVNLSESVGLIPGVTARDRQNYAQDLQLSIRGFGARSTFGVRGVRLYVDGIPATMPDGQGQLSHIDLASAARIEVLRGPFSVLYGNSSGGVVQVFTQQGEGAPVAASTFTSGSDGLRRPGVRVSGSTPGLRYAISANRFESQGWRDHSEASRDVMNGRLDFERGEGSEWTLVANSLRMRADDPLGLTRAQFEAAPRQVDAAAQQFDTRKTVQQDQIGVVHDRSLGAGQSLRLMVYAGQRATTQFQSIPVATQANVLHPGGVIGLGRRYAGTDWRWTSRRTTAHGDIEWVAGISYDMLIEHRQGWQNFAGAALGVQGALRRDEDNRVSNVDPYAQLVWKLAPRWTLTAGVRHSSVRFGSRDHFISGANGDDSGGVRYGATLPVAALMFALSPDVHLYASAGRGFETPTFNELAYRAGGLTGLNFTLKPSDSTNVELGVKGRTAWGDAVRTEWNATAFQTTTANELVTQTNVGGRSTFQNAGATRRRGVEASWTALLGRAWRVQFAQAWLDATYRDGFLTCASTPCAAAALPIPAGNRIPGTAHSVTAAELAWQPDQGWRGGIEARRSSEVFANDANTQAAPAFTTFALNGGYVLDVQRWSLAATARIDNVFNRRYVGSVIVNEGNARFFEPAPGRTWVVKLSASYNF